MKCEKGRFSGLYQYYIRLLVHFTTVKPLNFCNFLCRSVIKMFKKVQMKNKEHYPSLFHHSLIKVVVLHQLEKKNIAWDTFSKAALQRHETTSPSHHQDTSAQPTEVGLSNKSKEVPKEPRTEVTKTYQR